jgi:protein-tyrosine-phosphatase
MAEGFAKGLGKGIIEAHSAGSRPSGKVNPLAIELMKDVGIDISKAVSKGFDDLPIKDFDLAVTLGCKDTCPFVPADKRLEWEIEDPQGKDKAFFCEVRDKIKEKVADLVNCL